MGVGRTVGLVDCPPRAVAVFAEDGCPFGITIGVDGPSV
jgi:hypothetical protein